MKRSILRIKQKIARLEKVCYNNEAETVLGNFTAVFFVQRLVLHT